MHLPAGTGVILRDDREYLEDVKALLNKGPRLSVLGFTEEIILEIIRLSMGPKDVLLGGSR